MNDLLRAFTFPLLPVLALPAGAQDSSGAAPAAMQARAALPITLASALDRQLVTTTSGDDAEPNVLGTVRDAVVASGGRIQQLVVRVEERDVAVADVDVAFDAERRVWVARSPLADLSSRAAFDPAIALGRQAKAEDKTGEDGGEKAPQDWLADRVLASELLAAPLRVDGETSLPTGVPWLQPDARGLAFVAATIEGTAHLVPWLLVQPRLRDGEVYVDLVTSAARITAAPEHDGNAPDAERRLAIYRAFGAGVPAWDREAMAADAAHGKAGGDGR